MRFFEKFKKSEQKDISPKVSRLEQPEESLIVDSNAKTSKNTLLKSTVIAGAALKTLIPDPGMTTEVPTLESDPSMKQESVIDNKIIPLKDKIEQEIGRPVILEPTKGINKQTDYQEIPLTKSHQQWLAKFEITLDTDKNTAIWLDKESGREFILPQNISTILSEDTWLNPDTYNRRDNNDGTATITDPETALEIIIPNTISNDKWRYLNESDTAPDKYPLDLQKNKTVVPVDGYDAAGYMLKKSGKMQPIEEKDRVRTPENAVDPDRLEKEKDTYYNAYDTAMENGDTFVSPTEKKVSPEQIKADLEKYYEASNNKEILKETLPNDDNETPSLDDSIPEKTPDSQSSEKLDSEVSTFEIPSDPEQAKKFADKAIQTLSRLMKKFPGVLTGKNVLLLTTLATSGLYAANNADAANLSDVYNNLEPNTSYKLNLTHEQLQKIQKGVPPHSILLNNSISRKGRLTMRHSADTQLGNLPLVKASSNGRIIREKSFRQSTPRKSSINLNPGIKNDRQWNINKSGSTSNIDSYDITSKGTISGGVTKHQNSEVGIGGVQIN
jgi:hypothetical protein